MKTFNTDVLQPTTYNAGQSTGASFNSAIIDVRYLDAVFIQLNCTGGTPVGTFVISGCNDCTLTNGSNPTGGTFVNTFALPTMTLPGGAATFQADLQTTGCPFLQVQYTYTSGTSGNVTIYVSGKAR